MHNTFGTCRNELVPVLLQRSSGSQVWTLTLVTLLTPTCKYNHVSYYYIMDQLAVQSFIQEALFGPFRTSVTLCRTKNFDGALPWSGPLIQSLLPRVALCYIMNTAWTGYSKKLGLSLFSSGNLSTGQTNSNKNNCAEYDIMQQFLQFMSQISVASDP